MKFIMTNFEYDSALSFAKHVPQSFSGSSYAPHKEYPISCDWDLKKGTENGGNIEILHSIIMTLVVSLSKDVLTGQNLRIKSILYRFITCTQTLVLNNMLLMVNAQDTRFKFVMLFGLLLYIVCKNSNNTEHQHRKVKRHFNDSPSFQFMTLPVFHQVPGDSCIYPRQFVRRQMAHKVIFNLYHPTIDNWLNDILETIQRWRSTEQIEQKTLLCYRKLSICVKISENQNKEYKRLTQQIEHMKKEKEAATKKQENICQQLAHRKTVVATKHGELAVRDAEQTRRKSTMDHGNQDLQNFQFFEDTKQMTRLLRKKIETDISKADVKVPNIQAQIKELKQENKALEQLDRSPEESRKHLLEKRKAFKAQLNQWDATLQDVKQGRNEMEEVLEKSTQLVASLKVENEYDELNFIECTEPTVMDTVKRIVADVTKEVHSSSPTFTMEQRNCMFKIYNLHKNHSFSIKNIIRSRVLIVVMTRRRDGWEIELRKIIQLCIMFQFPFDILVDPNKKDLSDGMDKFANNPFNKFVDSTLVFVMAHGGKNEKGDEYIETADQQFQIRQEIEMHFNEKTAKYLCEKPKIFVLQMCRSTTGHCTEAGDQSELQDTACDVRIISGPDQTNITDYMLAYSCQPGKKSPRGWFIPILVTVILDKAHEMHFADILQEARRKVRDMEDKDQTALPESASGLTKSFYLCPTVFLSEKLKS